MADGPQTLDIEHIESPQIRNVYAAGAILSGPAHRVRRDEVCITMPETQRRALISAISKSLMANEV